MTVRAQRKPLKPALRVLPALSNSSSPVKAFKAVQDKAGIPHQNPAKAYGQLRTILSGLAPYMPQGVRGFADPLALFDQRNPKFAEGSMPLANTPRGQAMDAILKLLIGGDARTTFKVGMDGFSQTAGGLIIIDQDTHELLLAVKGDIYNKGRIGVLGGQSSDKDQGNTRKSALRESGEEIGAFPFDESRLIRLTTVNEWRATADSRGSYNITSSFDLYVASPQEITQMQESFRKHVEQTGGDPEIAGLQRIPMKQTLELIRDGQMAYFDQTQAFLMTALCLKNMDKAQAAAHAIGNTEATPAELWQLARAISQTEFDARTHVEGDWRHQLVVETCLSGQTKQPEPVKAPVESNLHLRAQAALANQQAQQQAAEATTPAVPQPGSPAFETMLDQLSRQMAKQFLAEHPDHPVVLAAKAMLEGKTAAQQPTAPVEAPVAQPPAVEETALAENLAARVQNAAANLSAKQAGATVLTEAATAVTTPEHPSGLAIQHARLLEAFGNTYYGRIYLQMTDKRELNKKIKTFFRDCVDQKVFRFFVDNNHDGKRILEEKKPGWREAAYAFYNENINNQYAVRAEPTGSDR